jgi:hypothetical protein
MVYLFPVPKYRFSIRVNEGPPKSYITHLELYKDDDLLATEALCTWCKTRTFTIKDTIHVFRDASGQKVKFWAMKLSLHCTSAAATHQLTPPAHTPD